MTCATQVVGTLAPSRWQSPAPICLKIVLLLALGLPVAAQTLLAVATGSLFHPLPAGSGATVSFRREASAAKRTRARSAPLLPTATSTTLATSPNPSTLGQPVTLTAIVSPSTATGKVTFYDGATMLGIATLSGGQGTFSTTLLPTGVRSLRAYYAGDSGDSPSTSTTVAQNVSSLGQGLSTFRTPVAYPVGSNPGSIAVGDFNGDGKTDLAVANQNSTFVSVLIGNGDGTFQPAVNYSISSFAFAVAVADFNGDGIPDLAVASADGNRIFVFIGKGDGTFQLSANTITTSAPVFLAVGDFNGDGRADLAVGGESQITILLGNGDATFQALSIGPPGGTFIALGDFNGDGKTDLAVVDDSQPSVSVLLGKGDGTFAAAVSYPATNPTSVAVGDFNGDGKTDLAVGSRGPGANVGVLLGKGDGTFQPVVNYSFYGLYSEYVVAVDVDGDGKLDLVFSDLGSGWVAVLLGQGDGTFQWGSNYQVATPGDLVAGEFNGDGRTDLAVVDIYSNAVSVLLGTPAYSDLTIIKLHTGNFTQGQTGSYQIGVTNSGTYPTSGAVTVTDTLPTGLTATSITGGGWSCVLGTLTCTRSDALAAGASYPAITVAVNVANNAPASVTNMATVAGGGETNTANDTASDVTTINPPAAALYISKSHVGSFTLGQTGAVYTMSVTNNGLVSTNGAVTVVDTLPTGLTATAIAGTGWNCVLATLTCTRSDTLAAYGSYPAISVTVNVARNAPSTVTNTATVSGGGAYATGSSSTDPTSLYAYPFVVASSTHTGSFTQGQTNATYTLTVTNTGSAATNSQVQVVDNLPSGWQATGISGTGWSCNFPSSACSRTDALAAGASYPPITLTVSVPYNSAVSVTNQVTAYGGGEVNTPNPGTDPTTVISLPDLTVVPSHSGTFREGDIGDIYYLTVSNSVGGYPSAATSGIVTVTDTLPTGITATAIAGTGWTCTLATLSCTRSDSLGPNASYPPVAVTVNVARDAGQSLLNTATVAGGGEIYTANDTATDPTVITQVPDLTVAVTHQHDFIRGQTGTYQIVVTDTGGGTTSGTVTVTDTLPSGLTASSLSGTGWTCTLATLTCTRNDALNYYQVYPTIVLTVNVAANAPSSVTNSVTVAGGGEVYTADDTATDLTPILNPVGVSLSALTSSSNYGQPVTLTASVTPSAATGKVTFYDGAAILGVAALAAVTSSNVQATLTTTMLASGSRSLTARYLGDSNYGSGVSAALAHTVTVLPQNSFQSSVISVGNGPTSVLFADFNGDGKADLAFSTTSGITILLGNGDGTFQPPLYPSTPFNGALLAADFNGDGKTDLFVLNVGGAVMLLGNGDGTFQPAVVVLVQPYSISVVGDFNGDGIADLAMISTAYYSVEALLGNGDGTFRQINVTGFSFPIGAIAVGDFNHDGCADLVVAAPYFYEVSVMLGNCDGTFQTAVDYAVGGHPGSVAVADFNGDGNLDLAVSNGNTNNVSVLLGKGDGTFEAAANYPSASGCGSIVAGDLNGDGKIDVALACQGPPNSVNVLLGNGDGTLQAAVSYPVGYFANGLALGSIRGNGQADLVVPNSFDNTLSLLFGSQSSASSTVALTSSPSSPAYGQSVTLTATVTSGGAPVTSGSVAFVDTTTSITLAGNVALNSSGQASVSTSALSAGSHTIQASYSGTAGATTNTAVITVSKATLYVTANSLSMTAGANLPVLTATVTGLVNSDTFTGDTNTFPTVNNGNRLSGTVTGTLSLTTTATSSSGPGAYPITAGSGGLGLSASNYTIAFAPGTLTVTTVGPAFSAVALNFGNVAVGSSSATQTVTATNIGTYALNVTNVAASGDFSQTNNCATVAASGTCTIVVTFTPTTTGSRTGAITITDNAATSPQGIRLSGVGFSGSAGARVSLSNIAVNFGSQSLATTSAPTTVILTNSGGTALTVNSVSASGDFAQTNNCGVVAPAATCTISVTLTPTVTGTRQGSVAISDSAAGSPQVIRLSGIGTSAPAPAIGLSQASLNFGSQTTGTPSSAQTVNVTNTGSAALTITGVAATGDFAASGCVTSLAAGATCNLNVTFTPTVTGARRGTVAITDNAAGSPQVIFLFGSGT